MGRDKMFRKQELSEEQLEQFREQGILVVGECVEKADCAQLVRDMWTLSGMESKNTKTWYPNGLVATNGFMETYHHPLQWKVRTSPKIYNIFADLYEQDHLWVSIDRLGMKFPSKGPFTSKGFTHWDYDPVNREDSLQLQGVIALEDTDVTMGGFHGVPGMHLWLDELLADCRINPNHLEKFRQRGIPINVPARLMRDRRISSSNKPIPMKAGDMAVWRGEIAHGNGENLSSHVRFALYLTMFPADETQQSWAYHQRSVYENQLQGGPVPYPQLGWQMRPPPMDGKQQKLFSQLNNFPITNLSPLGKRLIGLESWYE